MGYLPGREKGLLRCGLPVCHLMPREETAQVQRHVLQPVLSHPEAEGGYLLRRVVEARYKEIGNLYMDPGGLHRKDRLQGRGEGSAALLPVESLIHRLDIDIRRIQVREQLLQGLLLHVPC